MKRTLIVATSVLGILGAAQAQLVDPSFEFSTLNSWSGVLSPFVYGQWGTEGGSFVSSQLGITPAHGNRMLQTLTGPGSGTAQTGQVVDVSAYASLIDSGNAKFRLSALFNGPVAAGGANGGVGVFTFGAGDLWGSHTSYGSGNVTLDNSTATWQLATVTKTLPVGTRTIVAELYYSRGFPTTQPVYIDAAEAAVVPEPGTIAAIGLGLAYIMRRRRGK